MIYYKVVSFNMKSARIYPKLEYKLNEWTLPTIPKSRIFIFQELETAKRFIADTERIFACEAWDAQPQEFIRNQTYTFEHFWEQYQTAKEVRAIAPGGSFGALAIKLLHEVKL